MVGSEIRNLGSYDATPDADDYLPAQTSAGVSYHTKIGDLPGGAPAGVPIVRKFAFAYNTANILTGATMYTPTVGDILLDAWVEITTQWLTGGSPAQLDYGPFTADQFGWWNSIWGGPLALRSLAADSPELGGELPRLSDINALNLVTRHSQIQVSGTNIDGVYPATGMQAPRTVPMTLTADPIKVCVSQDGTNTGADPGSSQGAAVLYLVTATPV